MIQKLLKLLKRVLNSFKNSEQVSKKDTCSEETMAHKFFKEWFYKENDNE